jgi:hypothetical protein
VSGSKLAEKDKQNMIIQEKIYEIPSEDNHKLEIIEIGEKKIYDTKFGKQEKFTLKIKVLDQKAEDGSDLYVFLTVSPSIGAKATLGKFVRRLGFNTQGSFDVDELVGVKFSAPIAHNKGTGDNAGKTYANVGIDFVKRASGQQVVDSI